MAVAFVSHPHCLRHQMGEGHPERPARLSAIEDELHTRGLHDLLLHREAPRASVEQLVRVHSPAHVEDIANRSPAAGLVHIDPDTWMCPDTFEAALRAAGLTDVAVIVGGIVPDGDEDELIAAGVAKVFHPGSALEAIATFIRDITPSIRAQRAAL